LRKIQKKAAETDEFKNNKNNCIFNFLIITAVNNISDLTRSEDPKNPPRCNYFNPFHYITQSAV
jgi:hypothetical protein